MSRGSTPRAAAASSRRPTGPCRVTVVRDAVCRQGGHRALLARRLVRAGLTDRLAVRPILRCAHPRQPRLALSTPTAWPRSVPARALRAFDRMWADLAPVGRARAAATAGSRGPARTTTCASGSPPSAAAAGSTSPRTGWATSGPGGATPTRPCGGDPGVVIGSHLDSVPDGGAFDGPLGVVSALAAVDALRDDGFVPSRPVGGRQLRRRGGRPVRRRLRRLPGHHRGAGRRPGARRSPTPTACPWPRPCSAAGRDPAALGGDDETLARVGTFVELHVEQGRALATSTSTRRLAVGSAPTSGRTAAGGSTSPARPTMPGTTRLEDRHDAMLGPAPPWSSPPVEAAERTAASPPSARSRSSPAASTPSPARVTGWLDARGADADAGPRRRRRRERRRRATSAARSTRSPGPRRRAFDHGPGRASRAGSADIPVLGTGAGHDAGILAQRRHPHGDAVRAQPHRRLALPG